MCPSGAGPRAGGLAAAPRARVRAVAGRATACAAQFTAVRARSLDAGAAQTRPAFPQAVTPPSAELRRCPRPQEHKRGCSPCAQGGALEQARAARARAGQQHVRAQQLVRVVLVPAAHRQRFQRGRVGKLQVGAVPVQQLPRLARALRRARRAARRPCALPRLLTPRARTGAPTLAAPPPHQLSLALRHTARLRRPAAAHRASVCGPLRTAGGQTRSAQRGRVAEQGGGLLCVRRPSAAGRGAPAAAARAAAALPSMVR